MAAGADNADQAENEGEDPARGAREAVAAADVCCEDEGGDVDGEFEDGDAASSVEFHVYVFFFFLAGLVVVVRGWLF